MKKYTTVDAFNKAFDTHEKCFTYLCDLKWSDGFTCKRCEHNVAIKGRTWYYRKCQKCKYDESCTAHTLFHKLKFPVIRAFMMVHQISTLKKGLSSCEMSRQHNVHQETAWFFKRKIQQAMDTGSVPTLAVGVIDSEEHSQGKNESKEDQKSEKENTIMVTLSCQNSDPQKSKTLIVAVLSDKPFDENQKLSKMIWTDGQCSSAKELYRKFELKFEFNSGENGSAMKWYIYNLKHWMRGIHHLVSLAHLQRYLNEYQYRFDRRAFTKFNTSEILKKMVELPWLSYAKAKSI